MTTLKFNQISNSKNPFIETCYGLTRLFAENNKHWIEYINEYGFNTQESITMMKLDAYINN